MAFPRKGSRLIVVDERRFFWRMPRRVHWHDDPPFESDMHFTVRLADQGGSFLVVALPYKLPDDHFDDIGAVVPSIVAYCVRGAIRQGWEPERKGKPFTYRPRRVEEVIPGVTRTDEWRV